jgi:pimeloyl-ACP methyl ester carboxylesterase
VIQSRSRRRGAEAQILNAVPTASPGPPGALTAALNWYRANDFLGYDRPVAVPTLFVAGTQDAYIAPSGVRATRNWVTGRYRLENLVGVGHDVLTEADGTMTALLLNHIATVDHHSVRPGCPG